MSNLFSLEYNGLTVGQGNGYYITKLGGVYGVDIRTSSDVRTNADGGNVWAQRKAMRTISIAASIYGDGGDSSVTDYFDKMEALIDAFKTVYDSDGRVEAQELIITRWDGVSKRLMCKVLNPPSPDEVDSFVDYNQAEFLLVAEDPYFEDADEDSYSCGLPVIGGFAIPFAIPFAIGGATGGSFTIENSGDVERYARFRINGPITNPRITNATTGETIGVDTTLTSGQYIDIYVDQTGPFVLFNGITNYRQYTVGDILGFIMELGSNVINFSASASSDQTGTLNAYFRNAFESIAHDG